jgi:hypothetical protein
MFHTIVPRFRGPCRGALAAAPLLTLVALVAVPAVAEDRAALSPVSRARAVPAAQAGGTECFAPEVVFYAQQSGSWSRTLQVVNDEAAWCELWDQLHQWLWPEPPCDTSLVDFTTHSAVVVGLGTRPNLCYGMSVPLACRPERAPEQLRLSVVESVPGADCFCGQSLVQPLAVLAVERPVKGVSIERRVAAFDCTQPPEPDL